MATETKHGLSADDVGTFRREGFLIYDRPVFGPAKFDALKQHFEDKLGALPDGYRPEAMDVPHFTDLKLFDWLMSDDVLDLVEPILGPNIALWSSHFICKPKGDGKRVPWHEDSSSTTCASIDQGCMTSARRWSKPCAVNASRWK